MKFSVPEAESVLKQLLDNLGDVLWISSTSSTDLLYVNPAFEDVWGMTREQLMADPYSFLEKVHPDDRNKVMNSVKELVETAKSSALEYRIIPHEGTEKTIYVRNWCVTSEDGKPLYLCGITEDVTARRLAEEELRHSEERFRGAFDNAPNGMALVAPDGTFLMVNDSLCQLMGLSKDELLQTDFQSLTYPDDLDADLDNVKRILRGEITTYRMEKRYVHKEGNVIWALLSVSLVSDREGKPLYFVSQINDITDLKKAQALSERARLMEQREDFMATLTHDMKSPLLAENRILDLLVGGKFGAIPTAQAEILEQIKHSNLGQLNLIQNLLEVYRYEKDVETVEFAPLDLAELTRSCIDEYAYMASNRALHVSCSLPDRPIMIEAEGKSIRRMLYNLFDNAVKFAPHEGQIKVSLKRDGEQAVFEIEDNGPGIAEAEVKRLYQRFWRGEGGKEHVPGSGLGLYLCKKIIDAHNGLITCSSRQGEGTRFTVALPLKQPADFKTARVN